MLSKTTAEPNKYFFVFCWKGRGGFYDWSIKENTEFYDCAGADRNRD